MSVDDQSTIVVDSSLSIKVGKKYFISKTRFKDLSALWIGRTSKMWTSSSENSDPCPAASVGAWQKYGFYFWLKFAPSPEGYKIFINNSYKILDRLMSAECQSLSKNELHLIEKLKMSPEIALRFDGEFELQSILVLNNETIFRSNLDIIRSDQTKVDLRLQINQSYEINFDTNSKSYRIRKLFKVNKLETHFKVPIFY